MNRNWRVFRKLKSISTTDRLSKSVSDYVLKLKNRNIRIMQKDFTQVRLIILQRFLLSSETASLTDIAKRDIASLKRTDTTDQVVQREEEIKRKKSIQVKKISNRKTSLVM